MIGAASSRAHADERGQSLVEVALCLPILLLIVIGIVDIGRVYSYKVAVTNAAREAALFAARDPQATANSICQRARDELGAGLAGGPACGDGPADVAPCVSASPITVTCTRGGGACGNVSASTLPLIYQTYGAAGANVEVRVKYQLPLLTTYLVSRAFDANPVTVCSSAAFEGLGE